MRTVLFRRYMKLEDPGVELAVESKIKQFAEIFEKQMAPGAARRERIFTRFRV